MLDSSYCGKYISFNSYHSDAYGSFDKCDTCFLEISDECILKECINWRKDSISILNFINEYKK